VYPQPACLKLLLIVSNWRQPIATVPGSEGSTAIEGSFAASPTMFSPELLTFTWVAKKLRDEYR
jgi:hypothetical protein